MLSLNDLLLVLNNDLFELNKTTFFKFGGLKNIKSQKNKKLKLRCPSFIIFI